MSKIVGRGKRSLAHRLSPISEGRMPTPVSWMSNRTTITSPLHATLGALTLRPLTELCRSS